jgi:hypothetical protein
MTDKPNIYPDWCISEKNCALYPQSKIQDGWIKAEPPPSEWVNFFNNLVGKWTRYFDETISKISNVGVPLGVALPTFPSLGGYKCESIDKADELGFVLCNGQVINDETSVFNGKVIPNLNANLFLKGSSKDNKHEGNKNHEVNFEHVHNFAHTHEISQFQINSSPTGKLIQLFNLTPDAKAPSKWDQIISFNGTINGSDAGNSLQIVTPPTPLTTLYSGGVSGSAVNGFYDDAKTSGVVGSSVLNIEPESITTIYIMRIK